MKTLVANKKYVISIFVTVLIVFIVKVDIAHAVTLVTNLNQPYTWVRTDRTVSVLNTSKITTNVPYAVWVAGGLAQGFTSGSNKFGYNVSSVEIRIGKSDSDSMTIPSSVSLWSYDGVPGTLWSSSNGVPGSLLYTFTPLADSLSVGFSEASIKFESNAILESNTNYFIVIRSNEQSRITVTSSPNDDPSAFPGWSIHNKALKREGDIWELLVRSDVGNAKFPVNTAPRIRLKFEGTVLDSRTIIVSLTQVGAGQFKATATTSVPSDIVLPITIINGTIADGSTTVTIPAGSTESDVINVSRTPGTTFPVTVDIGNLPSPPAGYALFKTPSRLPIQVLEGLSGGITPVSERTPQVREAIVRAAGVNSANEVTEAHLAAIRGLGVNHPSGTPLSSTPIRFQTGDFSGLTALTTFEMNGHAGIILPDDIFDDLTSLERLSLYNSKFTTIPNAVLGLTSLKSLNIGYHGITSIPAGAFDQLTQLNTLILDAAAYGNTFTSLPDGVFDKLTSLTRLNLDQNKIASLPDGVFDQLTSLESLSMARTHSLSSLPAGVFDQLTSLTFLSLQGLKPTSLPDGIFSELSSLTFLYLSHGRLTNLPEGIFSGLSSLTSLRLEGNAVDPMPLTVSLEKVGDDQFKAVAPAGAPFEIVVPVNVRNGSISGGANALTFLKGNVESASLTVTRTTGTTAAVTVNIGTLPELPTGVNSYGSSLHQGYTLVKSTDLPIVVISRLTSGIFTISDRTPQVRDAIVAAVPGVNSANDVTEAHLAAITSLNLSNKSITTLKVGDFEGLTGLEELSLYNNQLTNLPEDIFDGLTALTTLRLYGNQLSSLPEDIFDELTSLTMLQLGLNQFTTLPGTIFDGLTKLTDLRMIGNQFTTLPEGIFEGLTGLTRLYLGSNAVNPLPLTVSLEKVGDNQFKAVAPTGAPFNIVLPLSIANGTTYSGATTITIPTGGLESEPLTVLRTSYSISSVTVNIGTLPTLPANHTGYALAKSNNLPLTFTNLGPVFTPIRDRTPQVRDQITLLVRAKFQFQGVTSVNDVAAVHLSSITYLSLRDKSITSLKAGDFSGMSSLETLILDNNSMTRLPADVFDGLSTLKKLWLQSNGLTSLPAEVFDGLSALERLQLASNSLASLPEEVFNGLSNLATIDLSNNSLTNLPEDLFDGLSVLETLFLRNNSLASLPEDIFDGLSSLITLELSSNSLASLPGDIFDGVSSLTTLRLSSNALTSLPEGVFEGLSNLTSISMHSNSARLLVTVSLERVGEGQFKAVASTGAPFDMVLPLTITNGSISSGATTVTLPAGSIESVSLTVTRTPSTTAAVTVDIGTLPGRPSGHFDYRLVKSDDLPLEVISASAPQVTGVNIPDANLRTKIESALRKTAGDPITATEMATLTTLNAQDARISNLAGLETATNITTLKLGNNTISDISALASLTSLTELQLWDNQISNLWALSGLSNLTRLYLWGNTITDISHLSGLTSLTQLRIGENSISNISAVAGLTDLTYLSAKENAISNISALARLTNLTELQIGNNTITDIDVVKNLTKLVWLDMPNNRISDISAVQNLTQLVELYFQNNTVSNLSPLVSNTGLGTDDELDMRGNLLSYPSIYTHIPALQARNAYVDFDNRTPTAPVKISGDTQEADPSTTLAQPFVVEVRDGDSTAFAGVPVTFAVTAGGGRLSATNTATDTNGRAQSTLTLGNTAGANTVRVSVQGISQTATFTAAAATANTAPVFTDGISTTRTITENTAAGVNIGTAIIATDADNDTLTYTLGGTDATAFSIVSTSGQLRTHAALDYETKTTYTVTITASDGSLTDTINVTINITDFAEDEQPGGTTYASGEEIPTLPTGFWIADGIKQAAFSFSGGNTIVAFNHGGKMVEDGTTYTCLSDGGCRIENRRVTEGTIQVTGGESEEAPEPTNTAPVFSEGGSASRTIAENAATGVNIGAAITATDADNDTLTYTLSGTDSAAFNIESTTGQLQTQSALDYETKSIYTVTITVSDGTLTDTITVTINVTNIDETSTAVTTVNIPDPNLRAKIETALGKTSGDPISAAEMETLTSLNAQDARITNLTGLETATNLTTLKLGNNSVSDISALAGLTNLTELQLWDNQISNLSSLTRLTNLLKLYVWGNNISDISHLSGLTSLTHLRLGENSISNISIVSRLTNLVFLSVKENAISDISAVSGLTNLTQLQIGNNTISDITPVQNLTNLEWLDMPNNSISDISAVQNLTQLAELYFQNNAVSDLSPLVANTGLGTDDELDARGNPLSYPSIYTYIPALQARNVYVDFDNRVATAPTKISGDTQQGAPSTTLAQPFVVEVRDGSSVAFAGVPVTFAVTAGGGTLSAPNTTTDTNGRAQSTLTLGNTAGANTVRVSVQGISQTATFTATAATANTAPVFTDGISTTRAIAENIAAGINIGTAITATDADNDTLTYTLGGTDAASFSIVTSSGQLRTQSALDYETKSSYSVTVSVSDGNGGINSITVTINVTDVNEQQTDVTTYEVDDEIPLPSGFNTPRLTMGPGRSLTADNGTYTCVSEDNCIIQNGQVTQGTIEVTTVAANTAPMFTDGTSTTRSIAENTAAGVSIGTAITATDTNNDILTYTLSGTEASAFSIDSSTGQLQTKSALDYETKRSYTVTITVSDGSLTDTITVTINITDVAETPVVPTLNLLSDRTPEVRDAIVSALPGVGAANDVTDAHLATITGLNLTGKSIASLKTGDFDGLSSLQVIFLNENQLTSLPPDVFSGLSSLTDLYLNQNQLASLPANLFSGLTVLRQINLHTNRLTNLPTGIFSGLSSLTQLFLHNNRLTNLRTDVFTGLSSLQYLYLHLNQLTNLPAGVFSGLSSLTQLLLHTNRLSSLSDGAFRGLTASPWLWLQGNAVDPLLLTVSLEKVGVNQFKATAPAGVPFTITLPLRVANGNINTGATDITIPAGSVESQTLGVTRTPGTTGAVTVDIGTLPGLPSGHQGYKFAKSNELPLKVISAINSAPVFTEGTGTTRTVAENTEAGVYIGTAIAATDADNDTLTYTLGGTDAATFDIEPTTGRLKTKATLDYETKRTYTVTVSVSDGSLADTINVTINISDVDETLPNTAPVFSDGTSTTRTVAENTASGVNIGAAIVATDADNDTLTYTLGGTDAASFSVNSSTRQLRTKSALDYETKRSYTVTVSVSDGSLTDTINVTINISDVDETPATTADCQVGDILAPGESCTYPGTDAVFSVLDNGSSKWSVPNYPWLDKISIGGSMSVTVTINDAIYHFVAKAIPSNSWVIEEIGDDTDQQPGTPEQPEQPQQPGDGGGTPTLTASTTTSLTEPTLDESIVTLTLSGGTYERSSFNVRDAVTVSTGISGVTVKSFDIDRENDTEVTVELTFDGSDFDTNSTITFTVGAGAIADYDGGAITAQIPVTAVTESITASTAARLTEATLDGSVVTLTLSGRTFERSGVRIRNAVTVSGISGVTVGTFDIERVSDTQVTVELTFDGNMNTDGTLTFSVGAGAIAGYNGPALTAQLSVSASTDTPIVTDVTDGETPVTPQQPVTPQPETPVTDGGTPTLRVSTASSLTEATLHGGVATLTLSGGTYESTAFDIRRSLTVSGITGATFETFSVVRVSDTEATVELDFDGNISTNGTLTFNLGSDAIANYDGATLTSQLSVPAVTESVVASTPSPLTEATLDESVVTVTLSGRQFEGWNSRIRGAVSVSGISGVTVRSFDIDRVGDTQVTVELTFDGNMNTDGTLTFTVGAGAITGYDGPALKTQVSVSASDELVEIDDQTPETPQQPVTPQPETPVTDGSTPTLRISTASPLTEATLHGEVATLTLSGGAYESTAFDIRRSLTVSGITGADFETFSVVRVSNTKATVELDFDGNISTNGTLTFNLGSDAIANYDGATLTSQLSVPAVTESVVASTPSPLTEATLDESVVTVTLSGRRFEGWNSRIRGAVSVSGISGVTVRSFDIDRVGDTQVTVELTFDGNIDSDSTLTLTVGADAIAGYNGPALTDELSVSASTETPVVTDGQNPDTSPEPEQPGNTGDTQQPEQPQQPGGGGGTPTLSASTAAPLTEAALHESVVTLTLTGGTYERSRFTIGGALTISGIPGVTVPWHQPERKSDTQITVELEFNGNISTNSTLTFTVGAGAIADYNGAALTVQVSVSANTESVVVSSASPLTEATLHESIVTLTLNGAKYADSIFDIRDAVTVSGIGGVTKPWNQPERESDTKVTVELEFDGSDFDSTSTLTFTVAADAIAGYNGPALTTQLSVTAMTESVTASTAAPLAEVTLDGSVVTLTLNGASYEGSIWKIRDAVTVSGITGVTMPWNQPERESDTEITIELEFDGHITTDSTLTFTVGADAIANYTGAALTAQLTVTASKEFALAANFPNPFNPETWIPYQLAEDADVTLTIHALNGRQVRRLKLGHQTAGTYYSRSRAAYWDGKNKFGEQVASGVYFYTLTAGDYSATRKMLIIK